MRRSIRILIIRGVYLYVIKRVVCIIILGSLMLHFSSRVGMLSFVYKKRHAIQFFLGLIKEVPMTECRAEYNHEPTLTASLDLEDESVPPALTCASEINLFFNPAYLKIPARPYFEQHPRARYLSASYKRPVLDFFQPPKLS